MTSTGIPLRGAALDLRVCGLAAATRRFHSTTQLMNGFYAGSAAIEGEADQPNPPSVERVIQQALEDAGYPAQTSVYAIQLFSGDGTSAQPPARKIDDRPVSRVSSLVEALLVAQQTLAEGQAEAVLLYSAWSVSDPGAAAIVLTGPASALPRPAYAVLRSAADLSATIPGKDPGEPTARLLTTYTLHQGLALPADVGLFHVYGLDWGAWREDELSGLAAALPASAGQRCGALSYSPTEEAGGALLALVETCLCLADRRLPGYAFDHAPAIPAQWLSTCLYMPDGPRTWFRPARSAPRLALLVDHSQSSAIGEILIGEALPGRDPVTLPLADAGAHLLLVQGRTGEDFSARLDELIANLDGGTNLAELRRAAVRDHASAGDGFTLALVGSNPQELRREALFALKGLPQALQTSGDWQTPSGSFFTARPLGPTAPIAFVYPGAFNTYTGVSQNLLAHFPRAYQEMAGLTTDLGRVLREEWLYPRSTAALTQADRDELDARLTADAVAMLSSGSTLSVMDTLLMEGYFGVHPAAALGYSLGETSMLFATQTWAHGDQSEAALRSADLFKTRLAGERRTVREYWGLTLDALPATDLWANFIVMAEPQAVAPLISGSRKVFLTHVNTPRQVVIGGDPDECRRVIDALKATALRAPFDHVLHCAAMADEYPALLDLNLWPLHRRPAIRLYSADQYAPLSDEPLEIAASLSRMLCRPLDFPRLVHTVYQSGVRVFLELGAGSNCARWIDETLKGEPHLSLSIDRKGVPEALSITRAVARLACHQIPVDLAPFLPVE